MARSRFSLRRTHPHDAAVRVAIASTQQPKGTTMKLGKYTPSQVRKSIVAGIGVAVILANSALETFTTYLPDEASNAITWCVGLATAVGVFLTRNAPVIDQADNI